MKYEQNYEPLIDVLVHNRVARPKADLQDLQALFIYGKPNMCGVGVAHLLAFVRQRTECPKKSLPKET